VAAAAADNNLLKFSARGHLLNAGICHLAGEIHQTDVSGSLWRPADRSLLFSVCTATCSTLASAT